MKYGQLGKTGIEVSRLCVGCLSFGQPFSDSHMWTLNPEETETIVRKALDLGFTFFDTANTYSHGTSEEYLGRAIKNSVSRDKVILATKVYFNEGRLSKEAIFREIDSTLKRLQTDYLDLYIIHRFDYDTPMEETMEALNELVNVEKYEQLVLLQCMDINFITCKSLLGTIIGLLFQLWKIITTYFIVKMKKN